ncbi:hypothetical protein SISNIDRAFT_449331 [Sistotremastrum niveocremeum HHB9708]|uniref:Fork-head domain-containing protein n=2 Tax=Sistotremastraceae TaxID=3402574 RepID=A0A164ZJ29_9AGAM|nr:hypothetical protein SISNIDRAFT_449331 [Sistotremastrum niveocremeum HHB9708]KZT42890.1 hypothetical protein SISSUDRAFT_1040750 [Sistotremastrum suecicum HHB10207 ss-3]
MSAPPPPMIPPPDMAVAIPHNSYYPEPPNDLSGGLPINLDSLRDGPPGTKPFYPYSTLIRYAIKGSPNQRLLLEDIYYAIESRFPYFRTAPAGWKNSVRHNLSLNPCFEKVARPLTDRGKGSYWTVNDNVDPRTGVHRVRKKRGGKGGGGSNNNSVPEEDRDYHQPDPEAAQFTDPRYSDGMGEGPGSNRGGFPPYPFDQAVGYPIMPGGPFGVEGETELAPEVDAEGQPLWRNIWLNELTKMQHVTAEQEKAGGDPEWYRMMATRIRGAFMPPDPQMGMVPHPDGPGSTGQVVPDEQ